MHCVAIDPGGKVLLGGDFLQVDGLNRRFLARLDADGSVDRPFAPSPNTSVRAICVQPDGKILAGGSFTNIGQQARQRIARLNADGTVDPGFEASADGAVRAIAIQQNGQVLIAGEFTTVNGVSQARVARLDADGTLDPTFRPAVDGNVLAVAVQLDGRIVLGGEFERVNGVRRDRLARLESSGRLDVEHDVGANASVSCLALQVDGMLVAGGSFTELGGLPRQRAGRVTEGGAVDPGFRPGLDGAVLAIHVQDDGRLVLGGEFQRAGGSDRLRVARFTRRGELDNEFRLDVSGRVRGIVQQSDGQLVVTGEFLTAGGEPRRRVARVSRLGYLDKDFSISGTGLIRSITRQSDEKYILTESTGMLRFHPDGRRDEGFPDPDPDSYCSTVVVQDDGGILVAGGFVRLAGAQRRSLGRLLPGGQIDPRFAPQLSGGNPLAASVLALYPDGRFLVGGTFTHVDGQQRVGLARFHRAGTLDTSFNARLDRDAYSAIVYPDGKIVIGGVFQTVAGQSRPHIARLHPNGNLDPSFAPPEFSTDILALALQPNGQILAAGGFSRVNGILIRSLARLDPDGTLDESFSANLVRTVLAVEMQPDGKILIAGDLEAPLDPRHGIARLFPDGRTDPSYDTMTAGIRGLLLEPDGKVVIGGSFLEAGGLPRRWAARYAAEAPSLMRLAVDSAGEEISFQWPGPGAHLQFVHFELSTDGGPFVRLGSAVQAGDTWRLGGLDLPLHVPLEIRARTYTSTGVNNACSNRFDRSTLVFRRPEIAVCAGAEASQAELRGGQTVPLAFGTILPGESKRMPVTVENRGSADLQVSRINAPAGFAAEGLPGLPATIPPGQSLAFDLVFSARDLGRHGGEFEIVCDDLDEASFTFPVAGGVGENAPPSLGETVLDVSARSTTVFDLAKAMRMATDPDGDPLALVGTAHVSAQGGIVRLAGNLLSYSPPAGFAGIDQIELTLTDGVFAEAVSLSIRVTPAPDASTRNPARFTMREDGVLQVDFHGIPGYEYAVERTIDMVRWVPIATAHAGPHGHVTVLDPSPPSPTAIYRLVSMAP